MRFRAILNSDGGTLRTMDLDEFCRQAREVFAAEGHDLDCQVIEGKMVEQALNDANSDANVDVVLAGGGDGTISTAAAQAFASGKPLAILPAGTMNLFARALVMPLELQAALEGIARGQIDHIDIATANGRPFVHQFSVGIHARLVRIRNGMVYRSRVGKMIASLRAIAASAMNPPRFEVELLRRDGGEKLTVTGIAISNNPLGDGLVPVAARLDSGNLGVYVATGTSTWDLLRLAIDVLTGHWRDNEMVREAEVPEIVLRFPKRKRGAEAVVDGELIRLERTVTLKVHPKALAVMRPRPAA